jgi:hypothetical protein
MTSTPASRSSSTSAAVTSATARGPLDGYLADLELHCGPTASGVLDDVTLGRAVTASDQPDPAGQERQPAFAIPIEQALGGQARFEDLEPGQQVAHADRPDLPTVELQGPAPLPERRLGLQHDARTFEEGAAHGVECVDEMVADSDMSTSGSRRVRYAVLPRRCN